MVGWGLISVARVGDTEAALGKLHKQKSKEILFFANVKSRLINTNKLYFSP